MKIKITHKLTDTDILNIHKLLDACYEKDNIKYTPYLGEEGCNNDIFIMAYDKSTLTGFLYCFDNDISELSVYVHPEYRRQGIATRLFKKLPENEYILSGKNTDFAKSLGFTDKYHEFLMEHDPSESTLSDCPCHTKSDNIFLYSENNTEIANCSIFEEEHTINIYDIYVEPDYRNRGYGRKLLTSVLKELTATGKRIILQVSELNTPAYRLYVSLGFKVVDSVLFFRRI